MPETSFSFFVQWHLTERCNLKCRHCYQGKVPEEMSYEEICQAMDEVKSTIEGWAEDHKIEISPSLQFTGGEPVVRRDLFPVLNHARALGFSLALLSNGTLITEEIAHRIAQAGVEEVQVSLEGLKEIHDSIRGGGSFERAVRGIRNLVARGIDTHINITLSRVNAGEIEGLIGLSERIGIGAVTFSRLVPCGRGKGLAGAMLAPTELAILYEKARQLSSSHGVAVSSRDPIFTIGEFDGDVPQVEFPIGGCAAGMFGVTIASDGGVMPCRRMDMVIGNIKEQSLRELWAESPVMWALRDRRKYHGGCETCYYWAVCRGCRAIALAVSPAHGKRDYLGADPQCPYHKPMENK